MYSHSLAFSVLHEFDFMVFALATNLKNVRKQPECVDALQDSDRFSGPESFSTIRAICKNYRSFYQNKTLCGCMPTWRAQNPERKLIFQLVPSVVTESMKTFHLLTSCCFACYITPAKLKRCFIMRYKHLS